MSISQGNSYKIVNGYVITNKFLGSGTYGQVYRGYKENDPKQIVAAKILALDEAMKSKSFYRSIKQEIEILGKISSPYIVKLYDTARSAKNYYIFLEYCNGGDLRDLLKQKGGYLSESEALTYFKQIVYGFKAIYQENVIHRDIKPANILIHNNIAKITDFGFARVIDDMEFKEKLTLLGTPLYMSPQILGQEKFSSKCDIWSLGTMFFEMLYGQTPWIAPTQLGLLDQIKKKPLIFPQQPMRSEIIKDLISKMLAIKEEDRLTWYDLFEHELIKCNSSEIKDKLNLIIGSVQDSLEQSQQLNRFYIDNNLVLIEGNDDQEKHNAFKMEMEEAITQAEKQESIEDLKGLTYDDIIEAQSLKLQEQQVVSKINSYLMLMRNVGIFVNLTTNNFFSLFKDQIIVIPTQLFYRVMYVLQKYQMIIFEDLTTIMASKKPIGEGFSDQDWKLYKKNSCYFTTLKAIKTDKFYIKPYFEEIANRAYQYLQNQIQNNKLSTSDKEDVQEFISFMNLNATQDQGFNKLHSKTLKICLKSLYEQLCQNKQCADHKIFLQTTKYINLCLNQVSYFKQNQIFTDFNKFYEIQNNTDISKLLNETIEDLKCYQ